MIIKIIKKILDMNYLMKLDNYFADREIYKEINLQGKTLLLYAPNHLIKWRVKTFFSKEPNTLNWIDSFKKDEIFWDIGANIGLYSLYAAVKYNLQVVSFEPSTNNTRILSRNISKNNCFNKIKLFTIPLIDKENSFLTLHESSKIEGSAHNSFGNNLDQDGKNFNSTHKYTIYGTTINYLLDHKILELPNHIKIDVDGFEHLILKGADKYLSNINIKSVLVELNENYKEQSDSIFKIMEKNNFKVDKKDSLGDGFYNYIFKKN